MACQPMRLHASELRVRVALADFWCRGKAGVCLRDCRMVFHPFAGFSIVTLGLHLAVDLRDTAFCFLYNALHFVGEGSFLTLPLALYRVNPLLGRQT